MIDLLRSTGRRGDERQREAALEPAMLRRFCPDLAAVSRNDVLAQRESDAVAARFRRREAVEQPAVGIGGNAWAVVDDLGDRVFAAQVRDEAKLAARRRRVFV